MQPKNPSSTTRTNPLLTAVQTGWQSTKANVVPGLVIVFLAGMLVVAYYLSPSLRTSLQGLQNLRTEWKGWFTMASSAVGAGLIPGVYLILTGRARRHGWFALLDLLYTCLVWAVSTITIDQFYIFQNWLWGPAVSLPVLLGKMLLDQFIFTPLIGIQIPALGFRLRDMNYDLPALGRALREGWFVKVILPMLVACWLTWIPGTLVIYALPLSLQIPMFVLIQCFFALEIAYASSKM